MEPLFQPRQFGFIVWALNLVMVHSTSPALDAAILGSPHRRPHPHTPGFTSSKSFATLICLASPWTFSSANDLSVLLCVCLLFYSDFYSDFSWGREKHVNLSCLTRGHWNRHFCDICLPEKHGIQWNFTTVLGFVKWKDCG